jgi:hypothetical protein
MVTTKILLRYHRSIIRVTCILTIIVDLLAALSSTTINNIIHIDLSGASEEIDHPTGMFYDAFLAAVKRGNVTWQ